MFLDLISIQPEVLDLGRKYPPGDSGSTFGLDFWRENMVT